MFQTQIIVIRELDTENHTWLKALSDGMDKRDMKRLFRKVEALTKEWDRELADSVLEVSIQANRKIVEELREESNMCQALLEIMEPEISAIKRAAALEAQQQGLEQTLHIPGGFTELY